MFLKLSTFLVLNPNMHSGALTSDKWHPIPSNGFRRTKCAFTATSLRLSWTIAPEFWDEEFERTYRVKSWKKSISWSNGCIAWHEVQTKNGLPADLLSHDQHFCFTSCIFVLEKPLYNLTLCPRPKAREQTASKQNRPIPVKNPEPTLASPKRDSNWWIREARLKLCPALEKKDFEDLEMEDFEGVSNSSTLLMNSDAEQVVVDWTPKLTLSRSTLGDRSSKEVDLLHCCSSARNWGDSLGPDEAGVWQREGKLSDKLSRSLRGDEERGRSDDLRLERVNNAHLAMLAFIRKGDHTWS